ncbi:MAG TPA: cadherin repeat domain-containing protein, partial [Fibrobacteria bacterium]|nr:cadherin repeat domain-containing protein [Fibrobacteria bacterium]
MISRVAVGFLTGIIFFIGAARAANTRISISSASSNWTPVLKGSNFDMDDDQQANSSADLVGNDTLPLLYILYDDGGTPTESDDTLAFRFRLDAGNNGFSGAPLQFDKNVFLGIDLDLDNDVDVFLSLAGNNQGVITVSAYDAGNDANNSPNTSSFANPTTLSTSAYSTLLLNLATLGESEANSASQAEYFFNIKFSWTHLVSLINTKHMTASGTPLVSASVASGGIGGLTKSTVIRYVVASSINTHNLNGDFAGYDNNLSASLGTTFENAGAFSASSSFSNQTPAISSNGGGATASLSFAENGTGEISTVTASDPEGGAITYSLSGGADQARFTIHASTGVLTFVAPPDYESPADADSNNSYLVTVRAMDADSAFDTQTFTITVTNVSEPGSGPTVASVSVPTNGTYTSGQNLDFTVSWSGTTTVTG